MGLAGLAALGLNAPVTTKTALIIVETDGCFVDGVRAVTGASVGHRTLRIQDVGKIAATFTNLVGATSLRLAPKPDIRLRAIDFAADEKRRYFAQLKGYEVMPDEELFNFQKVELKTAPTQIMSHQIARAICSNCGEEIINEREAIVDGKVLCQTCAFGGYYRVK